MRIWVVMTVVRILIERLHDGTMQSFCAANKALTTASEGFGATFCILHEMVYDFDDLRLLHELP